MIDDGLVIVYSTAAVQLERQRTYAKRRAKSKRHWVRMDKKYAKRYGTRAIPSAYLMRGGFGIVSRDTLVVHPALKSTVETLRK